MKRESIFKEVMMSKNERVPLLGLVTTCMRGWMVNGAFGKLEVLASLQINI